MKKEILALLVVVACWGPTLQANDWKNAPIAYSGRSRTPIPVQREHHFRTNVNAHSGST